ncbi:uncharacterized protein BO95DRAFT_375978, partial [Aspergillus brunneoviolaceus CBS 621.78]
EDVTWCTFLHGLFELMAESSGDSFATHLLFGTSRVLSLLERALEPARELSRPTKSLVDAFATLESHRAILYGDKTPGGGRSSGSWSRPRTLRNGKFALPRSLCSLEAANAPTLTLLFRLFDEIEAIDPARRSSDPGLDALARAGLAIRDELLHWQQREAATSRSRPLATQPSTRLAAVLMHALLLYHSMNFTFYYPCWSTRTVPRLTQTEVDDHVAAILDLSGPLLADTDLPAVLLLFPVRMAGVHASANHARDRVLGTIGKIRHKGFLVADRIEVDLQEVWAYEGETLHDIEM